MCVPAAGDRRGPSAQQHLHWRSGRPLGRTLSPSHVVVVGQVAHAWPKVQIDGHAKDVRGKVEEVTVGHAEAVLE